MNRNSLKFRIPFFIMVFAAVCVLITGLLFQYVASNKLETDIMTKNLVISKMISNHIDLYLENAKSIVEMAASFSSQSFNDMDKISEEIFRIYDNFHYFDLIFYMNTDAKITFSKPSNIKVKDRTYTDRSYYWDVMNKKETTISPLLVSRILNIPHFVIAAPVKDYDKNVKSLVGAGLPLYNIQKVIKKAQKQFDGRIWVVDENGVIAVGPELEDAKELKKLDNRKVYIDDVETDMKNIQELKQPTICKYIIDDKTYYGAITFVPNVNWMVIVEQDKQTIFSEVIEFNRKLKSVLIIVILAALALGLVLARKITNPIERLVIQVRRLSCGLKNIELINIDLNSKDEIGELGQAFNDMSIKLKHNLKELQDSYIRENKLQQYLNNILKSVTSGILVIDRFGTITIFNKEAEEITEFKADEFINRNVNLFFESTNLSLENLINSVLYEGKTFSEIELVIKSKTGKEIPISISASQVLDDDKNVIGIVILFRDLTRIKIIEEELQKEDRIRTLGELSASIIHDIGNPLAGINNLIEILKDDNELDEDTKLEVLDVMEKEVKDLNNLVINFLDFGRNSHLERQWTNIYKMIDSIINLLKPEIIDKEISLNMKFEGDNILISVNRRTVKQALINIFKNAIQAVDNNGKIDVETNIDSNNIIIAIRDNGIGIDKDELENIFYPFYTSKEEGTGLGLFIAYKVIKEHNGQMKVKSEKNMGTEFLIKLPFRQN